MVYPRILNIKCLPLVLHPRARFLFWPLIGKQFPAELFIIMKLIFISRRPEPLTRVHAGHLGSYETQTLTLWVWVEPQLPREVHVVHGQGHSCDRHWAWKRN